MARPRRNRTGRPGRPQTPPPILRRRASEPFEGADLLDEICREQGALALWQALRDVLLWAFAAPGERREGLFATDAWRTGARLEAGVQMDPDIILPLHEISAVHADPTGAQPEVVAEACRRISRWAEGKGFRCAALAYAYCAAVVDSGSAGDAYRVGQLARRNADHSRAEAWLRRAIGVARRAEDSYLHALALVGLGNVFLDRGEYPGAERAYRKALGMARRHGLPEIRGLAFHDLFRVTYETGSRENAEAYARHAFRAYGPRHPRQLVLAHDMAVFWLARGQFQRASDVLSVMLRLVTYPPERVVVLGNIAYAAGGLGDRKAFLDAWMEAWSLIDRDQAGACASSALDLAAGASMLEDWERADIAASLAFATAVRGRDAKSRLAAEAMLESIRGRQTVRPRTDSSPDPEADRFAASLLKSIALVVTDTACRPRLLQ